MLKNGKGKKGLPTRKQYTICRLRKQIGGSDRQNVGSAKYVYLFMKIKGWPTRKQYTM